MRAYQSIAASDQYQAALLHLREAGLQSSDLPIPKAFCDVPGNTPTSTKLAEACVFQQLERAKSALRYVGATHWKGARICPIQTKRWLATVVTVSGTRFSRG